MYFKTCYLGFLFLCSTFVTSVWCTDFSSLYTQARVILELDSCISRVVNYLIQKQHASTRIGCGQLCSGVDGCRRFMYDGETRLCSLFKSGENCLTAGSVDTKVCYRQNFLCNDVNCSRCPVGYYGNRCQHIIQDCYEGFKLELYPNKSMLSFIRPSVNGPIIEVICGANWSGWTRILHRDLHCLEINFNRTFDEYSNGFGNPLGNYFIGLGNIHNLVKLHNRTKLNLAFNFVDGTFVRASYDNFKISNKTDNYRLSIDNWDSMSNGSYTLNGRPFSTFDRDFTNHSCPVRFGGGWWYLDDPSCSRSNLHGQRSGADFQSTWHWQDNMGNKTSFNFIILRLMPL